jgi:hypothetical protein
MRRTKEGVDGQDDQLEHIEGAGAAGKNDGWGAQLAPLREVRTALHCTTTAMKKGEKRERDQVSKTQKEKEREREREKERERERLRKRLREGTRGNNKPRSFTMLTSDPASNRSGDE